jgi:hypothetical protein
LKGAGNRFDTAVDPCGKIKVGELSSALSVPGARNADLTRDDRFVLGGL